MIKYKKMPYSIQNTTVQIEASGSQCKICNRCPPLTMCHLIYQCGRGILGSPKAPGSGWDFYLCTTLTKYHNPDTTLHNPDKQFVNKSLFFQNLPLLLLSTQIWQVPMLVSPPRSQFLHQESHYWPHTPEAADDLAVETKCEFTGKLLWQAPSLSRTYSVWLYNTVKKSVTMYQPRWSSERWIQQQHKSLFRLFALTHTNTF